MLENKLGITDSTELARMEEKISKQKALEMFESGFFETLEPGTYKSLAMIHQYLFDEIYNFAGKLRKVNISKGNFRFAPLMYMKNKVDTSENHLKTAIQYAMVGNYIDFGALENVNEGELKVQLDEAVNITIDSKLLDVFKNDLVNAKRLVYFTDNCGEIVTDKLLISTLRDINPDLHITVIVRGKPVLNDATLEDAKHIHMEDVAQKVIGNGTGLPGNVIGAISQEAMTEVENADLLISKGQGNYEGLSGCGLNIYYLFLCKCEMFMRRFGVEQFTGIMTRECNEK